MKKAIAILSVLICMCASTAVFSVSTVAIDDVRSKGVLESEDLSVIDNYVEQALLEYAQSRQFREISEQRREFLRRSVSESASSQDQYQAQFHESVVEYFPEAINRAKSLESPYDYKSLVNLLVLADKLNDFDVSYLAEDLMDHEKRAVRYWAVKCVTNQAIIEEINSGNLGNVKKIKSIVDSLEQNLQEFSDEELNAVAEFIRSVDTPLVSGLFRKLVYQRLESYRNWEVSNELIETKILKELCDKIKGGAGEDNDNARDFAQLFSYVMQRYIKGQDVLPERSKERLISVMVETEQKCIARLTGLEQSVIKSAIENDNIDGLKTEHDRLLGKEGNAGELSARLGFIYGISDEGENITAPKELPAYEAK